MRRAPRTLDEKVAELARDVEALKQRTTARAGSWVLSENAAGDLIATSPSGRTVTLSDTPEQITIVRQVPVTEEPT